MFAQATFARAEQRHLTLATTLAVTLEPRTEFTPELVAHPEHRLFAVERTLEAARVVAFRRAAVEFAITL